MPSAEKIEFTVVGPEAPLAAGIVDAFRAAGLRIFGPTRFCAQLESSKDFAKAFMQRHGIPTATDLYRCGRCPHYVDGKGAPIVIKADGLAASKGVVVAMTLAEAHAAIDDMLVGNKMGAAGARVVIEDFLEGGVWSKSSGGKNRRRRRPEDRRDLQGLRQDPIVVKDIPDFIVNRFLCLIYNRC